MLETVLNSSRALQLSVCAECRCRADLRSWSSGPHSAVTAQVTLASDARTRFVPAGSAGVSLPPRLCTWLPGLRSSAPVTPQRTSTTALFDYISAGRSTHCAFYHWWPHLLLHRSGTVCRSQSGHRRRCTFSAADWKPNFLPGLTDMTKSVSLHWLLLRDFTV